MLMRFSPYILLVLFFFAGTTPAEIPDPFLMANGINIRNGHGTGDVVQHRGVNLGG